MCVCGGGAEAHRATRGKERSWGCLIYKVVERAAKVHSFLKCFLREILSFSCSWPVFWLCRIQWWPATELAGRTLTSHILCWWVICNEGKFNFYIIFFPPSFPPFLSFFEAGSSVSKLAAVYKGWLGTADLPGSLALIQFVCCWWSNPGPWAS